MRQFIARGNGFDWVEKRSFQRRKDNATYADAKIADRQVENALSTYGVVHTYEVSFTSSTRYKWKGLAYSIEDILPGSAGYTLLQGVGHLSHGAQVTEDHSYISQIRAENLYKQIRLNHTKKDAWNRKRARKDGTMGDVYDYLVNLVGRSKEILDYKIAKKFGGFDWRLLMFDGGITRYKVLAGYGNIERGEDSIVVEHRDSYKSLEEAREKYNSHWRGD